MHVARVCLLNSLFQPIVVVCALSSVSMMVFRCSFHVCEHFIIVIVALAIHKIGRAATQKNQHNMLEMHAMTQVS